MSWYHSSNNFTYTSKQKGWIQKNYYAIYFIPRCTQNKVMTVFIQSNETTLTLIFVFQNKSNTQTSSTEALNLLVDSISGTFLRWPRHEDWTRTCDLERQLTWSPETSRSYRILGQSQKYSSEVRNAQVSLVLNHNPFL